MQFAPRRRRLVALTGSAALVAGILVPLGATAAQAAPTYTLTAPGALRAGDTGEFTLAASEAMPAGTYCVSAATGAGFTTTTPIKTAALGTTSLKFDVTMSTSSNAVVTFSAYPADEATCASTVPSGATVLASTQLRVSGVPADVSLSGDETVLAAQPATFGWSVQDASTRTTYLLAGDSVTVRRPLGNTTITFNGATQTGLVLTSASAGTFTAQNSATGTASIVADLTSPAGGSDTALLTTTPAGTKIVATPAAVTTAKGASTAFTVTLTGVGGTALPGVSVSAAVNGRNQRAAAPIGTTNSAGVVTWTLPDTADPTSPFTTDVVTFSGGGVSTTSTVAYGTPPAAGLKVEVASNPTTGSGGSFEGLPDSGPVYRTGTTPFSVNTGLDLTNIVPTASSTYAAAVQVKLTGTGGVPVPNTKVTLTGSVAGLMGSWVLDGKTPKVSVDATTNTAGQAVFRVLSTKTGNASWTATSGSLSKAFTLAYANSASDARTAAISPATVNLSPGVAAPVIGSVVDRYGNPVQGVPLQVSLPAGGPVTIAGGTSSTTGISDALGQFSAQVISTTAGASSTATVTAALAGSQLSDPVNTVAGKTVTGVPAGAATASSPVNVSAVAPTVTLLSPRDGAPISSNGYFNAVFTTTQVPAGTMAYLTLNGRAKAKGTVDADGLTAIPKIPAEAGSYAMRIGGGTVTEPVLARSGSIQLKIIPFGLNGASTKDDRIAFRVKTGNFSPGTFVTLTRNGIGVAGARIPSVGAPMSIVAPERPGTYQVRVNSNQGFVYGDHAGLITID